MTAGVEVGEEKRGGKKEKEKEKKEVAREIGTEEKNKY